MRCSQPFYGNGQCYSYNAFNQPPQNMIQYPDIVGEGEVSSVTLPDGTVQLFFTPTVKWIAPQQDFPPGYTNTNFYNPYWSPNVNGAWFVRSVKNPFPFSANSSYPRNEAPRSFYSSDCNLYGGNTGYQIKFHNDKWTSTTDIHYFSPNIRHYEFSYNPPNIGCVAVQVDTPVANNTTCHYEFVCSKPCHCSSKLSHANTLPNSASAMSLVDDKSKSKDVTCACNFPSSETNKSRLRSGSSDDVRQQLHLLPTDKRKKRIKLERKKAHVAKSKSTDLICKCELAPPSYDKSVATYNDSACGCDPDKNIKSPSCCDQCTGVDKPDTMIRSCDTASDLWFYDKAPIKKMIDLKKQTKSKVPSESGYCDSCCSCCSDTDRSEYE